NILGEVAMYINEYENDYAVKRYKIFPPMELVKAVAAQKSWDADVAPHLEALVESPRVLRSGSILVKPGYDRESGLYYEPDPDLLGLEVPLRPTPSQVVASVNLFLDDLLVDFPFVDQASRANALAFVLCLFLRYAIDGPTPIHEVDASLWG